MSKLQRYIVSADVCFVHSTTLSDCQGVSAEVRGLTVNAQKREDAIRFNNWKIILFVWSRTDTKKGQCVFMRLAATVRSHNFPDRGYFRIAWRRRVQPRRRHLLYCRRSTGTRHAPRTDRLSLILFQRFSKINSYQNIPGCSRQPIAIQHQRITVSPLSYGQVQTKRCVG